MNNGLRKLLLNHCIPVFFFCLSLTLHLLAISIVLFILSLIVWTSFIWIPLVLSTLAVTFTCYTLYSWTPIGRWIVKLFNAVTSEPLKSWLWLKLLIPIVNKYVQLY